MCIDIVWIFNLCIEMASQVIELFFYLMNTRHISLTWQRNFILYLSTHSVYFKSMFNLIFQINSLMFIPSWFVTLNSLFLRHLRDHYLPTERKKEWRLVSSMLLYNNQWILIWNYWLCDLLLNFICLFLFINYTHIDYSNFIFNLRINGCHLIFFFKRWRTADDLLDLRVGRNSFQRVTHNSWFHDFIIAMLIGTFL